MQKKKGQKAQAMNSSELAACFDHAILPTTLQQRCEALGVEVGSPAFDALCKDFAERIGLGHIWYLIMYPFTISADNCQKHPWVRRLLLRPRLREEQWNELEEKLQDAENKYVRHQAKKYARNFLNGTPAADDDLEALGNMLLNQLPNGHMQPLIDYERKNGLPYKMKRLRKMMVTTPWLRIVFPHQFMPLTPITPDVHQAIEHRVHELKLDLRTGIWKLLKDGENPEALMAARRYQELIIESAKRRSNEQGKKAIAGSIHRMRMLLHILRAGTNEYAVVYHLKDDGSQLRSVEFVSGTAGNWAATRWS
jgi:hypothetical protein